MDASGGSTRPVDGSVIIPSVPGGERGVAERVAQVATVGAFNGAPAGGSPLAGRVCEVIQLSLPIRGAIDSIVEEFFCQEGESGTLENVYTKLSDGSERLPVAQLLKNPRLKTEGIVPRLEERAIGSREDVIQLAIGFKDGEQRKRFAAFLETKKDCFPSLETRAAGRSTFEFGIVGVAKDLPFHYLAYSDHFSQALDQMGYVPGSDFDARAYKTAVITDADGTIWEAPVPGESPEARHLGNSPAKNAILNYLRKGGVLIINSGNDPERVIKKVFYGIPEGEKEALLSRILVAASGGAALCKINPDRSYEEIRGYREEALKYKEVPIDSLDVIYLGDDHKKDGNDWDAFEAAGFERSICVSSALKTEIPHELQSHQVTGKEKATQRIFESISKKFNSREPLFSEETIKAVIGESREAGFSDRTNLREQWSEKMAFIKEYNPDDLVRLFNDLNEETPTDDVNRVIDDFKTKVTTMPTLVRSLEQIYQSTVSAIRGKETALAHFELARRREGAYSSPLVDDVSEPVINIQRKLPSKEVVLEDARTIAAAFQQPTRFTKAADGVLVQTPLSDSEINTTTDCILINGNNDLIQVERMAGVYKKIVDTGRSPPVVVISGFGGHGTSPGSIFAHSEAATMGDYFQRLLSSDIQPKTAAELSQASTTGAGAGSSTDASHPGLILEERARNSGENVKFTIEELSRAGLHPRHILISGTPSAIWRQTASFIAQNGGYEWDSISMNPPKATEAEMERYFSNDIDAMISMVCVLREVASYLEYSMTTNYLAPVVPTQPAFEEAVQKFADYYTQLTGQRSPLGDVAEFCAEFRNASDLRAQGKVQESKAIFDRFSEKVKPLANYFRMSFALIERAHMEVVQETGLSGAVHQLAEQKSHTYRALDLHTPRAPPSKS